MPEPLNEYEQRLADLAARVATEEAAERQARRCAAYGPPVYDAVVVGRRVRVYRLQRRWTWRVLDRGGRRSDARFGSVAAALADAERTLGEG